MKRIKSAVHFLKNTHIIRVSFFLAISTLVKIISGFITSKFIAIYIGPVGLSLMGQLTNFVAILLPLSTGGVNVGITKYVAQYNENEKEKLSKVLSTSLRFIIICAFICSIVLFAFNQIISRQIFKSDEYSIIIKVLAITISFYALNTWIISVLNGFKDFKKFNAINIIGNLIGLILTIIFSINYGTKGALLSIVLSQSVLFFISAPLLLKSTWFKISFLKSKIDFTQLKLLAHYTFMALITAATVPVSQLLVREYLFTNVSPEGSGMWEAMNRISSMYLLFITTTLVTYYLPRLSEIKDNVTLKKEVYSVSKITIPIVIFTTIVIFIFRNLIIQILFTKAFGNVEELFLFQLIGDVFKIVSWLFAMTMLAKAKTTIYVTGEVIFAASFYLLTIYFVNNFGLIGATYAYAINYFCYLLYCISFFFIETSKTK